MGRNASAEAMVAGIQITAALDDRQRTVTILDVGCVQFGGDMAFESLDRLDGIAAIRADGFGRPDL